MSVSVHIERDTEVAVIVIDHPPVNALAQPVRQALLAAIEATDTDVTVRAIVIHGAGPLFIGGADIREFDHAPKTPLLNELLLRLEACNKPVIAALHGATLGGGAELALACHYRCATPDLQLGFPEVKLGLLPGSGATVRLPRAVGIRAALDLMTSGTPIAVERTLELGLVDRMVEGDIRKQAVAYAKNLIVANARVRRLRERALSDTGWTRTSFEAYRAQLSRSVRTISAADRIISAVEATATRPFANALAEACVLFEQCRTSTESAALRHLFFAERGSRLAHGRVRQVERVGIIGAGTMGPGIALTFAQAGYEVLLIDQNQRALDAGFTRIQSVIAERLGKNRISAGVAEAARRNVRGTLELAEIAASDLIVEAVVEDMQAKQGVFGHLRTLCKPGAVLATNTSTLDVDLIAAASGRPADVLGMHFFSPAHVMRLVEVVRGRATSQDVLATVLSVTKRLGKIGIVVGNCFGFVGNRMLYAYGREKELMLLEGATPEQIDKALEAFGMAMGPNAVGDLAGLDIGVSARRAWTCRPFDPCYYRISELLVEHGRLGRKVGRGFYRYDGTARYSDPEVLDLIRHEALRLGIRRRDLSDTEIVDRCVFALINEGAEVLSKGIAEMAADIDVIWCNGYGFPRTRGGPMYFADRVGLPRVVEAIAEFRERYGPRYWRTSPLLEELATSGRRLADWRRRDELRTNAAS